MTVPHKSNVENIETPWHSATRVSTWLCPGQHFYQPLGMDSGAGSVRMRNKQPMGCPNIQGRWKVQKIQQSRTRNRRKITHTYFTQKSRELGKKKQEGVD